MKKVFVGICILAMGLLLYTEKEETVSAVQLENIDALAADIMPFGVFCYGSGAVDCPSGVKVKVMYDSTHREDN